MGGCQNSCPFLGTLNIRCRIIIGTQKGTIILTTTHGAHIVYIGVKIETQSRPSTSRRQLGSLLSVVEAWLAAENVIDCGVRGVAQGILQFRVRIRAHSFFFSKFASRTCL